MNSKPKILGVNDDVLTCECCGKSNLKKTVVLDFGGRIAHYGETCAANAFFPHLKGGKLGRRAVRAEGERRFNALYRPSLAPVVDVDALYETELYTRVGA